MLESVATRQHIPEQLYAPKALNLAAAVHLKGRAVVVLCQFLHFSVTPTRLRT